MVVRRRHLQQRERHRHMKLVLKMPLNCMSMLVLTIALSADSIAQVAQPKARVPDAPKSQLLAVAGTGTLVTMPIASALQASVPPPPAGAPRLTRSDAEQMAI